MEENNTKKTIPELLKNGKVFCGGFPEAGLVHTGWVAMVQVSQEPFSLKNFSRKAWLKA